MYSLNSWCMHTMYLDHIYLHRIPSVLQDSPIITPFQFVGAFSFFYSFVYNWLSPGGYIHMCMGVESFIHCDIEQLCHGHPSKKTDPLSSLPQLSANSFSAIGKVDGSPPPPKLGFLSVLILIYREPQFLWVIMCNSQAKSRQQHFTAFLPILKLLHSFCPPTMMLTELGCRQLIEIFHLQLNTYGPLFSVFWTTESSIH